MRGLRAIAFAAAIAALAPSVPAQAALGIGIHGGVTTPTADARALLDQELQLGVRLLLPPYTPIGRLPIRNLALDLGLEAPVGLLRRFRPDDFETHPVSFSAVYRYGFGIAPGVAPYLGLGARVTTLLGDVPSHIRGGLLFGRMAGSLGAVGGLSWVVRRGMFLDARVSSGLFGTTYWEATGGLLFLLR